ncbi:hypothetical protein HK102_012163, partial [Quaeritorhiza haematococci]
YKRDIELDMLMGVKPAHLCHINVPQEFQGKPFKDLFYEFTTNRNMIPIGLLRQNDDPALGNRLPFVYTNPLPSVVVRGSDLVYVVMA